MTHENQWSMNYYCATPNEELEINKLQPYAYHRNLLTQGILTVNPPLDFRGVT